jgi:tetratricopeptide (TPR) repeat protein
VRELTGELDAARAYHQRAIAIVETALGPDHIELAATLSNLGDVLFKLGDYAAARAHYQRSIDIREAALGPKHRKLGIALMGIANCERSLGDDEAALPVLERALSLREADEFATFDLAYTRLVLADVLWNLGHDRSRALRLAEEARSTYATVEPPPPILEQVTAWLEARRPN